MLRELAGQGYEDGDLEDAAKRNPPRGELVVELLRDGAARTATLDLG